jgi:predicted membrane-bound dolichyl-phosphate-mannose-protein mannosyltransferase
VETGAPPLEHAPEQSRPAGTRAGRRASSLGRLAGIAAENLHDPSRVLGLLLLSAVVLRSLWLSVPPRGLIFDEAFYVNAARVILGIPATSNYVGSTPGLDPNTEHPPLAKLLMAGSMSLFGDDPLGWRLPSIVAAIVALVVVFEIVRRTDASAWLAVLVVGLVSFDNLTFVHGRIGTLDMLVLAPMLLGSWLALQRRWVLAGIAVGVALLMKITAIYAVLAVGLWLLFTDGPAWWRARRIPIRDLVGPAAFVIVAGAVALAGLAVLDARFTTFASPFDHIARMISYGASLQTRSSTAFCPGADSQPWQWLFNDCQIEYFRVDVTVTAGEEVVTKVPTIDFRGALNPLLVGAIPLAMLFTAWYAWRTRSQLAIWAITWTAANYLPYVALAVLTNRIMYIYYALALVPALAAAVALLLLRSGLPPPVRWGFVAAYAVGFIAYFPYRQVP